MWAKYGLPDVCMANVPYFESHLSLETEILALQLWGEKPLRFTEECVNQPGNVSASYRRCLGAVSSFCSSLKCEFSSQVLL